MSWRARFADEAGMTLVEIIIATSLLGVVMGPITMSFFLGFLEADSARERIADSSSAQLFSSFFNSDVQSSESLSLTGTDCAPAIDGKPSGVRLQMTWVDPKTAVGTTVSYLEVGEIGGQAELHRAQCDGGGSADTTLLVLNLDADGFLVTCTPDCATPRTVMAQVTAKSQDPQAGSSYAPLQFALEATRRVD